MFKRFILMGGETYYASGGFEDYIGTFDTKEEAQTAMKEFIKDQPYRWSHYLDTETKEMRCYGQAEAGIGKFLR